MTLGRSIVVVARPQENAAKQKELEQAAEEVRASGHDVRVVTTASPGDARRQARDAARAGCDVVAAAGGDGTINEVVNGLVEAGGRAALAVVAMGTANDFAHGLALPLDVGEALHLAASGTASELDVARVNERCFINVSTGGFGADATRAASRAEKQRLGPLAYALHGIGMLARYDLTPATFVADGAEVYSGRYVFFAVGNARRTGGGAQVTPRADPGDGKLDIVILGDVSRLDFLTLLPDLRAGSHLESPDVLYLRANTLDVSAPAPLRVNADGEAVEGNGLRYEVLPGGLLVVGV